MELDAQKIIISPGNEQDTQSPNQDMSQTPPQVNADSKGRKKTVLLLGSAIFLTLFFVGGFFLAKNIIDKDDPTPTPDEPIVLNYWGLFEPEEAIKPLIDQYEADHPGIKINYQKKDLEDDIGRYKSLLKQQLSDSTGPDIFRVHSTWIPSLLNEVSWNNAAITKEVFDSRFYPVNSGQCTTAQGNVLCIPIMYDGLSLLYNRDMFEEEGLSQPVSWYDVQRAASALTVRDDDNNITRGGIAIGSVDNVRNSSDILGLVLSQLNVAVPDSLDTDLAIDTLIFYTNFVKSDKVWNEAMGDSIRSFAKEDVAMVFARTEDIREILELNPTLNFGVLPVPKVPTKDGSYITETWANFWVETVNADISEEKQKAAWDFLAWLSLPDQQIKRYNESSKYRLFGELPSDKTLYNNFKEVRYIGPILAQAPESDTNFLASGAGNEEKINIFKDAVRQIVNEDSGSRDEKQKIYEMLKTAKEKIKAIK